ncbi:porphobilinogen deaminase [Fervidicella metallireducens AeB]|uniref:Porphobilinogen deaminase n=1 Tax=Fervidicella metallireducens AeB TaxID=1403537 RepID=A0A017RXV1_9CLOT|nr:hydroxymethylbilane synthase [Fervidicella metallireducens]EYE89234.1 porphobilinogen deaminase [Fervidicella metallireducens AeB]
MKLNIATRKSKLAQVQTDTIIAEIFKMHKIECKKVLIETKGDMILDVTLDKIGGKGLFVKDIEIAMMEGRADAAVHSMKDVPYEMPEGFEIASMPRREDVRDVFVSMNGMKFADLPMGARIGTSSNRRSAQLKMIRPDIEIVPVRGNVQTRIDKIERENLHGIILAAAGLKRLNMDCIITDYFDPIDFVPAVGQGALGVEAFTSNENIKVFRSLDDIETRMCVEAERSFMRRLNGGCHTAIGAYAQIDGEIMNLVGIFELSGRMIKKDITGNKYDFINLGKTLAEKIIDV